MGGRPALVVWQLQGVSLLVLAAATCVDLWRARRARRDLTRLVVDLAGTVAVAGCATALAERLDDPRAGHRLPDRGRPPSRRRRSRRRWTLPRPPTDRVTHAESRHVELATLVHRPGVLSQPQQVDDLVASVRLALENERLAAEDLAQLAEIRSSGARIVAAGDAERRRIERDLHDGAQQRLVALLCPYGSSSRPGPGHAAVRGRAETELRPPSPT